MGTAPELILKTNKRALKEFEKIGAKTSALQTRLNMARQIEVRDGWESAERWVLEVREEAQLRGLISIEAMALQTLSSYANVHHQDPKRAFELSSEALDRIGEDWPDRSYRGDLLRWNAQLALRIGQPEIARERYKEALTIAAELNQRVEQVEILLGLTTLPSSSDRTSGRGEVQASVATLLDTILADPHGATELLALGTVLFRFPGRLTDARRAAVQARLIAKEEIYMEAEFEALLQLSKIGVRAFRDSVARGDEREATENVGEALHYARQAKQLADAIDHPSVRAKSLMQLGDAAKSAGDVVTAQKAFEEVAVMQTAGGVPSGEASVYLLEIAVRSGEIEAVDRHLESVKHYLDSDIPAYSITGALQVLVQAYLFKGEGESAFAYAQKLMDADTSFPHLATRGQDDILFAHAAIVVGKYDEAARAVKTARAHYSQLGRRCELCDILDRAIDSETSSQINKDISP
jgi:tetratricopeptide (TPR) repeat protein